jgi:hypothetical protein
MKKIKLTKKLPKVNGIYFVSSSKGEIELADIFYDKDKKECWITWRPNLWGEDTTKEPIFCYGPIDFILSEE